MSSTSRSPSLTNLMFASAVGLAVTCLVTVLLWIGGMQFLIVSGLIRGPRDYGPATGIEVWMIHNWPLVLVAELVIGAWIAKRICRPMFESRPTRRTSSRAAVDSGKHRATKPRRGTAR